MENNENQKNKMKIGRIIREIERGVRQIKRNTQGKLKDKTEKYKKMRITERNILKIARKIRNTKKKISKYKGIKKEA